MAILVGFSLTFRHTIPELQSLLFGATLLWQCYSTSFALSSHLPLSFALSIWFMNEYANFWTLLFDVITRSITRTVKTNLFKRMTIHGNCFELSKDFEFDHFAGNSKWPKICRIMRDDFVFFISFWTVNFIATQKEWNWWQAGGRRAPSLIQSFASCHLNHL